MENFKLELADLIRKQTSHTPSVVFSVTMLHTYHFNYLVYKERKEKEKDRERKEGRKREGGVREGAP